MLYFMFCYVICTLPFSRHYSPVVFSCILEFSPSGGSKGCALGVCSPLPQTAQNFLNFMQFFGQIWQNRMLCCRPLEGWRPLLKGNHGPAAAFFSLDLESRLDCSLLWNTLATHPTSLMITKLLVFTTIMKMVLSFPYWTIQVIDS